jgi:hypothetical protein
MQGELATHDVKIQLLRDVLHECWSVGRKIEFDKLRRKSLLLGPSCMSICDRLLSDIHADVVADVLSGPFVQVASFSTAGIKNRNFHSKWTISLSLTGVILNQHAFNPVMKHS